VLVVLVRIVVVILCGYALLFFEVAIWFVGGVGFRLYSLGCWVT